MSNTVFGVYAPLNSAEVMLIIPLYLRPSISMERKYGQFRRVGIIESKFHEVRAWGHSESLPLGLPLELIVTDKEAIQSIGSKMDSDASAQDVLLGIVSVH